MVGDCGGWTIAGVGVDLRDVGTRTHAWQQQKKQELQSKERQLKKEARQAERVATSGPTMSLGSHILTAELESDVLTRK